MSAAVMSILISGAAFGAAEGVPRAHPHAARRPRSAELLVAGRDPRCGAERAIGAREDVLAQQREIVIAAVEQVVHPGEDLEGAGYRIARIEVEQCVSGQAAIAIAVVFITPGVHAAAGQDARARRPALCQVAIDAPLERVAGT